MNFTRILPEDYRATSISEYTIGLPGRGCVTRAVFIPTQDIHIRTEVEAFVRLIARTKDNQRPLGCLRFARGKYGANEPVLFKLNSSTTLEGDEILYVSKEVNSGALAFPESVVQVECR